MTHEEPAVSTDALPFEQLRHEPRTLLGPGPSNIHPRVFQAMTSPILGYLDPDFVVIMDAKRSCAQIPKGWAKKIVPRYWCLHVNALINPRM